MIQDPFLEKAKEFIKRNGDVRIQFLPEVIAAAMKAAWEEGYQQGLKEKPEE